MRISNSPRFENAHWQEYVTIIEGWLLTPGSPGHCQVYAQFKDRARNLSKIYKGKIEVVP